MNEQYLRPGEYKFTDADRKKALEARQANLLRKNMLRDLLTVWMNSDSGVTDKNGKPMTGAEFMIKVAIKEMAKGNSKFWELLRDTSGQKPVEKVMVAEVDQAVIDEVEKAVLDE